MPSPICQGDSTTGGGEVTRCQHASTHRINGHPLAVKGDYASCSLHPGEHSFVEGSSTHLANGLPIVLEGHLLSCGCHAVAGKAAHIKVGQAVRQKTRPVFQIRSATEGLVHE